MKIFKNSFSSNQVIAGVGWSLIGEFFSKGLLFLSWIIIARILGKVGFGHFGIIRSTITMFAVFGGLGLGLTANKYVSKYKDDNKLLSGKVIALSQYLSISSGLVISIALLIFSKYISTKLINAPFLEFELKLSAVVMFFSTWNGSQIGILQGLEAYKRLAKLNVLQGLIGVFLFTVITYFFGITGAIIAYSMNSIITTFFFEIAIRQELKEKEIKTVRNNLKEILPIFWNFSIPAALTGIAVSPFKWYAESILIKSNGYVNLGIFQASLLISNMIIAISLALNAPLISITSNSRYKTKNNSLFYTALYASWYVFFLMSLPLIIFPKILPMILGKNFIDKQLIKLSLMLLIWCGMLMYYQGLSRLIMLKKSIWFLFFTNIVEGITLIISFIIYQNHGAIGLGLAYIYSYCARILFTIPYVYYSRLVPVKLLIDKYFIFSALIFGILIYYSLCNS